MPNRNHHPLAMYPSQAKSVDNRTDTGTLASHMTSKRPVPRAKGPAYDVTRDWQLKVEARLREMDWTHADLSRALKHKNNSSVALVLSARAPKQSRLVRDVSRALGLPSPITANLTEEAQEWLRGGMELASSNPEQFKKMRALMKQALELTRGLEEAEKILRGDYDDE